MRKFTQTVVGALAVLMPIMGFAAENTYSITIATGDGSKKVFGPDFLWNRNHNQELQGSQLVPGSVYFKVANGSATLQDNGQDGQLEGGYGNGFVDYSTGLYYIMLNSPLPENVDLNAIFKVEQSQPQDL
jgi:hypothetical protein